MPVASNVMSQGNWVGDHSPLKRPFRPLVTYMLAAVLPLFCIVSQFASPLGVSSAEDALWMVAWSTFLVVCIMQIRRPTGLGWVAVLAVLVWSSYLAITRELEAFEISVPVSGLWEGWPTESLFLVLNAVLLVATALVALSMPFRRSDAT